MNFVIKVGNSFGTPLNLHISWLWILSLTAFTLVWYDVTEWLGAIIVALLIFGSVLSAALAQLWTARRVGLQWQRMTLFLLGGVVERAKPSKPHQEIRVGGAGTLTYFLLCLVLIVPCMVLPLDLIQTELQTVALFNAIMVLFSLLLRLSPFHDNLLHAILATVFNNSLPHYTMIVIHSIVLPSFVIASVFMKAIGWMAFACWAGLVVMLSQLTSTAELYGEYQENLETRPTTDFANMTPRGQSLSHTNSTQLKKGEDNELKDI